MKKLIAFFVSMFLFVSVQAASSQDSLKYDLKVVNGDTVWVSYEKLLNPEIILGNKKVMQINQDTILVKSIIDLGVKTTEKVWKKYPVKQILTAYYSGPILVDSVKTMNQYTFNGFKRHRDTKNTYLKKSGNEVILSESIKTGEEDYVWEYIAVLLGVLLFGMFFVQETKIIISSIIDTDFELVVSRIISTLLAVAIILFFGLFQSDLGGNITGLIIFVISLIIIKYASGSYVFGSFIWLTSLFICTSDESIWLYSATIFCSGLAINLAYLGYKYFFKKKEKDVKIQSADDIVEKPKDQSLEENTTAFAVRNTNDE